MKILLINGSPKGKGSNSLKLTYSFLEGFKNEFACNGEEISVDELHIALMNIGACKGCFACWQRTPGICCIKDDMQTIIERQIEADIILWSFPLYYFNVPGILKNVIDRQLPMNLPFMSSGQDGYGSGSHDARYDMEDKRHVLISTCGFYSAEGNYDSVLRMFDHFLGKGNYVTVFCGQGELFRVKELSARTDEYLDTVKKAGSEYAVTGMISDETDTILRTLLYPRDVFEEMADASWGISKTTGEKESDDLVFTRQMAALYNKSAYDGKDRVLEMHYTDMEHTYQIQLGKEGSNVFTDGSLISTTRIDTPFEVWSAISRGEIGGAEALGKQMYTVSGDFSLMIDWDKFFGSNATAKKAEKQSKNTAGQKDPSMMTMLISWITFWIAVSINPEAGAVITLIVVAAVPLIMRNHKFVIWDQLSMVIVAILSAIANVSGTGDIPTNIGYLAFGLFWLLSCLTKEPLCAAYVKYNYGGERAHQNPLFMKTNYILAVAWGSLYVLTAVWTFLLRKVGFGNVLIIVNNMIPALMGVFTVWFEKWYPAWMASGKNN
ncbi:MAG: flavodoxin family protein [Lachnospiraceae bacterium]|nr:flavodoxin family protein [Lachnospiraceae bacterium]